MIRNDFTVLLDAWKSWATLADKSKDGWEALFPDWGKLMLFAQERMQMPHLTESEFEELEFCWFISEEDEPLADHAKNNINKCWPIVQKLATSQYPEVRWQAFDTSRYIGEESEPLLRVGLTDGDPYCRRRALLALVELKPDSSEELAQQFADDPDSHTRKVAWKLFTRSRIELLQRLAEYNLPIEPTLEALAEYGYDSDVPLFTITRYHLLSILDRYLSNNITAGQVTDWADLIECREDIEYEPGFEKILRQAIFELANPNLNQEISIKVAKAIRQQIMA